MSSLDTKVATVKATVAEENVVLNYRLVGSYEAFTMKDDVSGDIYTQANLDRESINYFLLTIEAVDNRTPQKTGYAMVCIYMYVVANLKLMNKEAALNLYCPIVAYDGKEM